MAAEELENEAAQENEALQCDVQIEDSGAWKKKISVTIPRSEIDKQLEDQYKDLKKTAEVPGFRKGHAPMKLVEKRFGDEVGDQAKLRLLAQAFEKIDEEYDFDILGEPDFKPDDVELPETGDFTFSYEIELKPEFDLPKLEGIKIEKRVVEIDDERIDNTLDELRKQRGQLQEVDTVEDYDLVKADVTMNVEGAEEPETQDDLLIRACESSPVMGAWIDNTRETLKGAKPGDTRTCKATLPDELEKEAFRGKEAEFTFKVNNIRRMIPAEVNEEFLQQFGADSEAELRNMIVENLENQADQQARQDMMNQVQKYLDENIQFELPAGLVARHTDTLLARQYYNLLKQGVPSEKLNENLENLKASSREQASKELKMSFILDKVADALDIEISDMEINGIIAHFAAQQGRRPERVRDELQKEGRLDSLASQIREEKALESILEMADVVDAPEEKVAQAGTNEPADADNDDDDDDSIQSQRKQVKRQPPDSE